MPAPSFRPTSLYHGIASCSFAHSKAFWRSANAYVSATFVVGSLLLHTVGYIDESGSNRGRKENINLL